MNSICFPMAKWAVNIKLNQSTFITSSILLLIEILDWSLLIKIHLDFVKSKKVLGCIAIKEFKMFCMGDAV